MRAGLAPAPAQSGTRSCWLTAAGSHLPAWGQTPAPAHGFSLRTEAWQGDSGKNVVQQRWPGGNPYLTDNFFSSSHLGKNIFKVICIKQTMSTYKLYQMSESEGKSKPQIYMCRQSTNGTDPAPTRCGCVPFLLHLLLLELPDTRKLSVMARLLVHPSSKSHTAWNCSPWVPKAWWSTRAVHSSPMQ